MPLTVMEKWKYVASHFTHTSKFHSEFPFMKHYFDLLHFTFSEMYLRKETN
jgi:hypothetical protein